MAWFRGLNKITCTSFVPATMGSETSCSVSHDMSTHFHVQGTCMCATDKCSWKSLILYSAEWKRNHKGEHYKKKYFKKLFLNNIAAPFQCFWLHVAWLRSVNKNGSFCAERGFENSNFKIPHPCHSESQGMRVGACGANIVCHFVVSFMCACIADHFFVNVLKWHLEKIVELWFCGDICFWMSWLASWAHVCERSLPWNSLLSM